MGPGAQGGRLTLLEVLYERQPEVIAELIAKLREGNYLETAAAWAGVSLGAVRDWLRCGNADLQEGRTDTPVARFARDADRARAEATARHVAVVVRTAQGEPAHVDEETRQFIPAVRGDWSAAAWWLERTDPERWGRRDKLRLSVSQAENLTDEELDREMRGRGLL